MKELSRVLFVIPDFMPGGAQKQCALLFRELSSRDPMRYGLAYLREGPNFRHLEGSKGAIYKIQRDRLNDPRIVLDIRRLLNREGYSAVMSWMHPADVYCGLLKVINPGVQWFMTERDSQYPSGWRYKLRERLASSADVIIANSSAGVRFWRERIRRDRPLIMQARNISPAHDLQAKQNDASERNLDLLSVGRLEVQKGVGLLTALFGKLCLSGGAVAAIAGSGTLAADVRASCAKAGVQFFGYVNDPTQLYRSAKVFVTCSLHEGTPNALIEALSAGMLVVASNIPEHIEVLGKDYPFFIDRHHTEGEALDVIKSALSRWNTASGELADVYGTAYSSLDEMSAKKVGDFYEKIMNGEII